MDDESRHRGLTIMSLGLMTMTMTMTTVTSGDLYEDEDNEVDEVVEGDRDRTRISGKRKKKGVVYCRRGSRSRPRYRR